MFAFVTLAAAFYPTDTESWVTPDLKSKWPTPTEVWELPPTESPTPVPATGFSTSAIIGITVAAVAAAIVVVLCIVALVRPRPRLDKKVDGTRELLTNGMKEA